MATEDMLVDEVKDHEMTEQPSNQSTNLMKRPSKRSSNKLNSTDLKMIENNADNLRFRSSKKGCHSCRTHVRSRQKKKVNHVKSRACFRMSVQVKKRVGRPKKK